MGGFFQKGIVKLCHLSGLKDIFSVFDQLVVLLRFEERVEAAACLRKG